MTTTTNTNSFDIITAIQNMDAAKLKELMTVKKCDSDKTVLAKAALRFFYLVSIGARPSEAYDMLLGAGTFEQVVSDLYDQFNA